MYKYVEVVCFSPVFYCSKRDCKRQDLEMFYEEQEEEEEEEEKGWAIDWDI